LELELREEGDFVFVIQIFDSMVKTHKFSLTCDSEEMRGIMRFYGKKKLAWMKEVVLIYSDDEEGIHLFADKKTLEETRECYYKSLRAKR